MLTITHNEQIITIIKTDYSKDGADFFAPNDFSQQLAFMKDHKSKIIDAHTYNVSPRNQIISKEVLDKNGKLRITKQPKKPNK